jgi:ribonuclease Z
MELIFLGTGAGMPSGRRNVSSVALRFTDRKSAFWMVDCGEGTQHQLMRSPLKLSKLEKVFITHLHGDHLYGLPGMLTTRSNQGVTSQLDIYGPKGLKAFLDTVFRLSGAHLGFPWRVTEIDRDYPPEGTPLFEDDTHRVFCARLNHRLECYGYRIEEKDKPGRLDERKLRELNVPPGPLYGRLKRGETVVLEDGRELCGKDFVGEPIRGRTVTVLGDTRPCANAERLARHADVLVHEATFTGDMRDAAREYGHSTSVSAAETAAKAGCRTLILTHISSRYQEADEARLLGEARAIFPDAHMAEDFRIFPVERASC